MRFTIALILPLLLAGCPKEALRPDPPPKVVYVEVKVPVSLCPEGGADCELLADCYDEPAKEQTYGEAKRLANLRKESLAECSARWAKVRKLQPKSKP